jgi:hypothetical protein
MVVIHSQRGTELGSVLVPTKLDEMAPIVQATTARVLRVASPEDLEHAHRMELDRPRRFEACQQILQEGVWPFELIDVEPMLDDRRTVLHYLGPHHLDATGLHSAFRSRCGLDVFLEPVGIDIPDALAPAPTEEHDRGCESCGSGGSCSANGGCGSGSDHGGCSTCGVKELLTRAGRTATPCDGRC